MMNYKLFFIHYFEVYAANTTLRNEKEEQRQRQLLINQTIAEGIRRIDAVNAATNLKHHF